MSSQDLSSNRIPPLMSTDFVEKLGFYDKTTLYLRTPADKLSLEVAILRFLDETFVDREIDF